MHEPVPPGGARRASPGSASRSPPHGRSGHRRPVRRRRRRPRRSRAGGSPASRSRSPGPSSSSRSIALRADRLPRLRHAAGATPHLDRLAAGATVFSAPTPTPPLSLPAHASLFTGRLPFGHQVRDDMGFTLAGDGTATLASQLADRGFDTAAAVSSFLLRPANRPRRRLRALRRRAARATGRKAAGPPSSVTNAATAKAATRWLDEQDSARFFYALQLNGAAPAVPGAQGAARDAHRSPTRWPSPQPTPRSARCSTRCAARAGTTRRWSSSPGSHGGAAGRARATPDGLHARPAPVVQVPLLVKMPGAAEPRSVDGAGAAHRRRAHAARSRPRARVRRRLRGRSFRAPARGRRRGAGRRRRATPRRWRARCASAGPSWSSRPMATSPLLGRSGRADCRPPTPTATRWRGSVEVAPTLLPADRCGRR